MRRINSDGKNSAENRGGGRGIRARMRIGLRKCVRAGTAEPGARYARRRGSAGPCAGRRHLPLLGAAAGKVTGEEEMKPSLEVAILAAIASIALTLMMIPVIFILMVFLAWLFPWPFEILLVASSAVVTVVLTAYTFLIVRRENE